LGLVFQRRRPAQWLQYLRCRPRTTLGKRAASLKPQAGFLTDD
jgi:hypothetical protein